jgi:hypothetical protein
MFVMGVKLFFGFMAGMLLLLVAMTVVVASYHILRGFFSGEKTS